MNRCQKHCESCGVSDITNNLHRAGVKYHNPPFEKDKMQKRLDRLEFDDPTGLWDKVLQSTAETKFNFYQSGGKAKDLLMIQAIQAYL